MYLQFKTFRSLVKKKGFEDKHCKEAGKISENKNSWGYSKHNGPEKWITNVPAVAGSRQSPINIIPSEAVFDKQLQAHPLKITYDSKQTQKLINTGHSIQVTYDPDGSMLEGGPLKHNYKVAQFHFHWGRTSETGSEHRVNGKMFAAEVHIVHYNSDLYSVFGEAAAAENGLAVLGAFVQVGDEHKGFKNLTKFMKRVNYSGGVASIDKFNPKCLLPEDDTAYWTYPGSLTTPPCYESVTWIVFRDPIEMSESQLQVLRNCHSHPASGKTSDDDYDGYIVENYRPPLPINNRKVRSTFDI